jgi:futalosine hydrolase
MDILLIAATEAEIATSIEYMSLAWQRAGEDIFSRENKNVTICISGVGMMASAYHITKTVTGKHFDMAIQAGIGGAFDKNILLGETVFITSDRYGDLGAEDGEAYIDIYEMGLAHPDAFPFSRGNMKTPPADFHDLIKLQRVSSLSVNMVTGNEHTVLRLGEKYNCQVESMEGAAFHYICLQEQVPFAQVRAISNYVERRNRENWKINEAILSLNNWLVSFLDKL